MASKTLRICLFEELPSILERDISYLYLAYDKLLLFFGQNQYYDPYVITESIPDNPAAGILYILFDGTVQVYIDDGVTTIAEIEDASQLEHISEIGTTFFIHADRRYLDLQYRTLQLPYHNGTYSLSVSMMKDLKINENTVIRYDPEKEHFYIDGEYAALPEFKGYKGETTKSVEIEVNNHCIHADVKISSEARNLLKVLNGGLYVNVDNKLSLEDFEKLLEEFEEYKAKTETTLEALGEVIDSNQNLVTEDSIYSMILSALENYYSEIDEMIEFYSNLTEKLNEIKEESQNYTDTVFEEKVEYLQSLINDSVSSMWGDF